MYSQKSQGQAFQPAAANRTGCAPVLLSRNQDLALLIAKLSTFGRIDSQCQASICIHYNPHIQCKNGDNRVFRFCANVCRRKEVGYIYNLNLGRQTESAKAEATRARCLILQILMRKYIL